MSRAFTGGEKSNSVRVVRKASTEIMQPLADHLCHLLFLPRLCFTIRQHCSQWFNCINIF